MTRVHVVAFMALSWSLALDPAATAQTKEKAPATMHASGAFDVTLTPQPGSLTGRQTIEKLYHGDLDGVGKGEMLSAGNARGSGAYVAIERVVCTLQGKKGEFALQHAGTMNRGKQSLSISVVPDSGTGDLEGLAGTMSIDINNGKHFYGFDYTITKAP